MDYTAQDYFDNPVLSLIPAFQQLDDWFDLDLEDTALAASPVITRLLDEVLADA